MSTAVTYDDFAKLDIRVGVIEEVLDITIPAKIKRKSFQDISFTAVTQNCRILIMPKK